MSYDIKEVDSRYKVNGLKLWTLYCLKFKIKVKNQTVLELLKWHEELHK